MKQMISLTAPAKINLNLNILGKRDDGYHELVSLVGFSEFGDLLNFSPAAEDRLIIEGRDAEILHQDKTDNLISKARDGLRSLGVDVPPTEIRLEKHIPIGGGLGGGSSDAATTIRGLIDLYDLTISKDDLHKLACNLGADVPACLQPGWKIMAGIGERILPLDSHNFAPNIHVATPYITLANPAIHVSTANIFSDLNAASEARDVLQARQAKITQDIIACWDMRNWSSALALGNDLTAPAIANCAAIAMLLEQIDRLSDKQTLYGYAMSGSGSSCFALFSEAAAAKALSEKLNQAGYWATATAMRNTEG